MELRYCARAMADKEMIYIFIYKYLYITLFIYLLFILTLAARAVMSRGVMGGLQKAEDESVGRLRCARPV
jgi:hypothetical protein